MNGSAVSLGRRRRTVLVGLLTAAMGLGQSPGWMQLHPQNNPATRTGFVLDYDAGHNQVVLFGGATHGNCMFEMCSYFNDTWIWDGSNWTQKLPMNVPSARGGAASAYDSAHGQIVVFGGYSPVSNSMLNETWVWDGSNWTQKFPQTSPPARFLHAMAYDAAQGQVVLFGGRAAYTSGDFNDTWAWDGSNWTQILPQASPTARSGCEMAYDPVHRQIVMFGGIVTGAIMYFSDTWVWDGSNWTQKFPQKNPSPRWLHGMTYDAGLGQIVVFGGAPSVYVFANDTWAWDGSNWIQLTSQLSPSGRITRIVYDAMRQQIVLFGGFAYTVPPATSAFNDTWIFQNPPPPPPLPSITGIVSASAFGGFNAVAPGTFVEIYGANLAQDTRLWAGSDFNGNNAPTSLEGVQVNIGGQKAFVYYISTNGQVNAQLPSNIVTGGPLAVTLTNANGTSPPFNVAVNATEPGLLAPASFVVGGKQYAVALLSDGVTYVLPTGAIQGVASRPARPGETILLFGIGFGGVTPSIPAGQIVGQSNQLSASFQMLFGQTAAQVAYDGLAPGYVGLYQFNVVVPAVPDNDLVPLSFMLGGAAGTQTLYIAVHQ